MVEIQFAPSNVYAFFPASEMYDHGMEVMAAFIVRYLAVNGDKWDTPIEWEAFKAFCATEKMIDPTSWAGRGLELVYQCCLSSR